MRLEWISSSGDGGWKTERKSLAFARDTGVEEQVVNLYPCVEYQRLEGFGGAVTDAAGYVFSRMSHRDQEKMLEMYFSPAEMNYQMVRIPVDSCDFSTHMYCAVEKGDETLRTFSFADTERYILPLLDRAQEKAGKPLKIMLSAWSPPCFMKTNGERRHGGSLKPEYRPLWAEYLCKYIETFQTRGYQVCRMSVQNEPKAVQEWDSCVYTAEEEKEFLRDYLHPALIRHGFGDMEVFIWDHNKERMFERAQTVIDRNTNPVIAGVAFHWYSGDHFEALDLVRQHYPDKKLILSESCLEFCKYDREKEGANAAMLAHDMIGNLNHGMEAFYDWNLLLDGRGGPNHVGGYCDAPYLYDEAGGCLRERRILNMYWHFAHFIKPGAVRIAWTKYTADLDVTAWKNPDGEILAILLNRTDKSLGCSLRFNGWVARAVVEPGAIVSGIITEEFAKGDGKESKIQ